MNVEDKYNDDQFDDVELNEEVALTATREEDDFDFSNRATNFDFMDEESDYVGNLDNYDMDDPDSDFYDGNQGFDEPPGNGRWRDDRRSRMRHSRHRHKRYGWDDENDDDLW
ncbi:MAG: hypothetical protein P1U89_02385 [Verrucomicrobiales bacterium]|nr:hypothetical protein [Verrucomicrobiales bacterium]